MIDVSVARKSIFARQYRPPDLSIINFATRSGA